MKVDLNLEFGGFDKDTFDDKIQMQENVLQKMLDAMSSVVSMSLDWVYSNGPTLDVLETLPQDELESFLTLGLVNKLVDRERMKVGSKIVSKQLMDHMMNH